MPIRWWGWGYEEIRYPLDKRPYFLPFLQDKLEVKAQPILPIPSPEEIELPPPRLTPEILEKISRIVGGNNISISHYERLSHAFGKSYTDLIRIRLKQVDAAPDAVVFPGEEEEISAILDLASLHRIAIIPFGGGTTVVGGVAPVLPEGFSGSICLDLRRMNRLLNLDEISRTATFEAGIMGPELEKTLNERGFTLGHFPQSFEFSSLGGWIATRSAGQKSTGYGKIEDMVISLRVVTPVGVLDTPSVPASASGPSLKELLIGSEGVLGIITRATLRIHPLPERIEHLGIIFPSFPEGIEAIREMLQKGLRPATVRLSDPSETDASFALREVSHGIKETATRLVLSYLRKRGFIPGGSLLILGAEGEEKEVKRVVKECVSIAKKHGGLNLGRSVGESWYRERFLLPYLRDDLITWGVMVDTLETATLWSNLPKLYNSVREAIVKAIEETGSPAYVMCHISHCYPEGASLYYTFLGRQLWGREIEQWWHVKRAATEAILAGKGTISHHHSVGLDHKPWLEKEHGKAGVEVLRTVKNLLDPCGIMNPGKLL